ncbi:efflux RND transporter periplasmic adaptor subunit [Microvirga lotononidis]|uniref:RND family efflux transporter, MFP subunit n=1 Tax=Microvirga lotononidis TaxID=864069 RepID=I4YNY0_9HYPH|nr:efflux RND transporter periplasmic adaptor subunit [Microvirga lotononidis]EIM25672.1 RND family efflux transporter, MFP subunit [Microvirga lotononidis]WQO26444.1 efflux RND transporter periplasmic adaptor subunit [Microvirga lotononidis]
MVEPKPTSGRKSRGLFVVFLILLLAGGGWGAWHWHEAQTAQRAAAARPAAPAPVPVQAASVEESDIPIYMTGLGSVQALNTVTVRSRVDGQIDKIAFQEGQMVKEGDLLLQIDPRPFQAALDQAVAKKAQDEAQLVSAKADLERTRQLITRDFASKQQLDVQQANVNSLNAQIQADQGAIDNATTQLSYTTIRAPLTGRTGLRQVDQGNIVHASDTNGIVQIAQIEPIAVIFTAPEAELSGILKAQGQGPLKVWALTSSGKTPLAEGELTLVNNQVDSATGTVRLKAQFANKDHSLWPGMSVDARLLVRTLKGVAAVPNTAVQRGPQGLFAYVVKTDNTVEMRPIKVGVITADKAVIESGVSVGERVVTAGHYRLQPGASVQVTNASETHVAAGEMK